MSETILKTEFAKVLGDFSNIPVIAGTDERKVFLRCSLANFPCGSDVELSMYITAHNVYSTAYILSLMADSYRGIYELEPIQYRMTEENFKRLQEQLEKEKNKCFTHTSNE